MSAIHQAVRRGDLREVGRLLDSGADIETYDEAGETPLMAACVSTDAPVELVRLLLDRGADPNALARPWSAAPSGDPDFCIYNDVIVHDGQGGFQVFGYPEDIFPPTDFHSATLVGEWIYLIGNLGYPVTREAFGYGTPAFRLHTGDWHIERVETRGEAPGWIHKHQAQIESDRIRVFQGSRYFLTDDGEGKIRGLEGSYSLELASGMWRWV